MKLIRIFFNHVRFETFAQPLTKCQKVSAEAGNMPVIAFDICLTSAGLEAETVKINFQFHFSNAEVQGHQIWHDR